MSQWINVDKETPSNKPGLWSEDVIALSDNYEVFRLACMDGHWQRSQAFISSGATKVICWIPCPEFNDE